MRIIIKRGMCKIIPTPLMKLQNLLDAKLSYKKQGAQFMPRPEFAIVHLYRRKTGIFPLGYLPEVKAWCEEFIKYSNWNEEVTLEYDDRVKETSLIPKPKFKPRDYQEEAIQEFLSHDRGIIALATGLGKTLTALHIMHRLGLKTLIVVHTADLRNQWAKTIKKQMGISVGLIYGGKCDVQDITIAMIQSLQKKKDIVDKFGLVVTDECHHISAKMFYKMGQNVSASKFLGISASPRREDGEDMKIKAIAGDIIYKKSTRWGIENKWLCPAKVEWIDIKPYRRDLWQAYPDIYLAYIVRNEERNSKIIEKAKNGKPTLVIVSQLEHGKYIYNKLKADDQDVIFLHGKIKNREKRAQIIIATSIFDEGVDLPDREVIIMAAGGKSSIRTVQRIGRVLRPSPGKKMAMIYDFKDEAKYLNVHYKRREAVYEESFGEEKNV